MGFSLRRKTEKRQCPDGSVKVVYRSIDDAFPLALKDFKAKVDVDLAALSDVPAGSVGTQYEKSIAGLLYTLGDRNQSLMMTFRAVYETYRSDPCTYDDFLRRQVELIISETNRHTEIQLSLSALIGLAQAQTIEPDGALALLHDLIRQVGGPGVAAAAAEHVQEAKLDARQWLDDRDTEGDA